jgi:hypothetical protein
MSIADEMLFNALMDALRMQGATSASVEVWPTGERRLRTEMPSVTGLGTLIRGNALGAALHEAFMRYGRYSL